MQNTPKQFVITFSCPDKLGVLSKFSSLFYEAGAFVTNTTQYSDALTERFFQRCVFDDRCLKVSKEALYQSIDALANEMDMQYQLRPVQQKLRILVGVSRYDHCLSSLLNKWKAGALPIDIVGVFSNHNDCRSLVEWHGLDYHHLPITSETKPQQEAQLLQLMEDKKVDLLVLARYMQILSDDLCNKLAGKAINIHHSFLPGFKGAKPYHQAYQRGVKKIGATAHYVTADLDEGPIIAQEVKSIDHAISIEDMVHLGHDIESSTLAQAVKLHSEQKIILNGHRAMIL